MPPLTLDLVQTVAFAGVMLYVGFAVCRFLPLLSRYNIPAPVIGGLLVSLVVLAARQFDIELVRFDVTLREPLMIAFFTSIGFGASLSLLRAGGPQVLVFFVASTIIAVAQNVVGVAIAAAFGKPPLLGVMGGSVALTGGPGTALAFAPRFEEAGVAGAAVVGTAAAIGGIIAGGLLGGPVGTFLIERNRLRKPSDSPKQVEVPTAEHVVEEQLPEPATQPPPGEDVEAYVLLKNLVVILVAMGLGAWLSAGINALGITLPPYIGAMLVAAAIRNLDDLTGWFGLSQRVIDDVGHAALSLFIVLALMTLKLWELAGLVGPLLVMLVAQVALVALVSIWPLFRLMGRDYESAVISSGFCGFMLGTTANSMANMKTLVERFGPAPRAFLVVPMVGAFFIDFTNALIITGFLNYFR